MFADAGAARAAERHITFWTGRVPSDLRPADDPSGGPLPQIQGMLTNCDLAWMFQRGKSPQQTPMRSRQASTCPKWNPWSPTRRQPRPTDWTQLPPATALCAPSRNSKKHLAPAASAELHEGARYYERAGDYVDGCLYFRGLSSCWVILPSRIRSMSLPESRRQIRLGQTRLATPICPSQLFPRYL